MFDFIIQQLPLGYKLEVIKRPVKGQYHRARIINRLEGCIYETQSDKSIDDCMTLMIDKIRDGGYL